MNWIRTSLIYHHLREAAHWNDSPVDEDRLYPRHRRPPLYRWWSSFIVSQHNCHQNNHCHHFSFFSQLPCTFRWLVSEYILEAPIPKLVVFQKPFGESEEKSLTLPWNYNSSGSYRPFGASASSSTLSSTTTTTSGESVIQVLKLIVEMRKKIKSVTRLWRPFPGGSANEHDRRSNSLQRGFGSGAIMSSL